MASKSHTTGRPWAAALLQRALARHRLALLLLRAQARALQALPRGLRQRALGRQQQGKARALQALPRELLQPALGRRRLALLLRAKARALQALPALPLALLLPRAFGRDRASSTFLGAEGFCLELIVSEVSRPAASSRSFSTELG